MESQAVTPRNLVHLLGWFIAIAFFLVWYFTPPAKPQPVGLTLEQQNELAADTLRLSIKVDSLESELAKVKAKETLAEKAHNKAVAGLQKKVREMEANPVVIQVRDSVPEIDTLITTLHVTIDTLQDRIQEMGLTARTMEKLNQQVKINLESQLSTTQQLLADSDLKLQGSEKEVRKLRRKLVWTKIGAVTLVVLEGVAFVIVAL